MPQDAATLSSLVQREAPDVICLQEHKLQEQHVEAVGAQLGLPGWRQHWTCSRAKLGYSGVVTLTREEPLSVSYGLGLAEHDEEGRVVTVVGGAAGGMLVHAVRVCGVWLLWWRCGWGRARAGVAVVPA